MNTLYPEDFGKGHHKLESIWWHIIIIHDKMRSSSLYEPYLWGFGQRYFTSLECQVGGKCSSAISSGGDGDDGSDSFFNSFFSILT